MTTPTVDLGDVLSAAERLAGVVHRTPVMTCATLDRLAGRALFFKCEQWQKVGAFKFRGATNAVSLLRPEVSSRGVVTHSSGNHAQALALAAAQAGLPAHIVMPRTAPAVKRAAVAGYGATIHECEPTLAARQELTARVMADTGAVLVHPFEDPAVIAGQGTAALELLEQAGPLDAVIVPVGGGGLAAGTCVAVHGRAPESLIFAAEPAGADDTARSFAAGQRLPAGPTATICDGLLTGVGETPWPILRAHLAGVITVTEAEIVAAMRLLWERAKLLVEPSAATVLALALGPRFRALPGLPRVGLILSGGNVDLERLPFSGPT